VTRDCAPLPVHTVGIPERAGVMFVDALVDLLVGVSASASSGVVEGVWGRRSN
jgi:hypothetical protein